MLQILRLSAVRQGILVVGGLAILLFALLWRTKSDSLVDRPAVGGTAASSQGTNSPPPSIRASDEVVKAAGERTVPLDVAALFQRALAKGLRLKDARGVIWRSDKLRWESAAGITEGRLLARAYPRETFELASAVAQDPSREFLERSLAVHLLGVLGKDGVPGAQELLLKLCRDQDAKLAESATAALLDTDPTGAHRAMYYARAEQGSESAFEALARWAEPGTISWLESVISKRHNADTRMELNVRRNAEDALKRLRILMSAQFASVIDRVIKDPSYEDGSWTDWALAVGASRDSDRLRKALRSRLDHLFGEGVKQYAESYAAAVSAGDNDVPTFERAFSTFERLPEVPDPRFDTLLVAYAELKGQLHPIEIERLTYFGYMGDSSEVLRIRIKSEQERGAGEDQ
jgi:hypothetical protein